jgi:hypothetical protein
MKSARDARIFRARLKGGLCDRKAFARLPFSAGKNCYSLMEVEADKNVVL